MATLSSDKKYVTVVKGDTLSEIAQTYGEYIKGSGIYGTGGKLKTLVDVNDIDNQNYIVVGQKIYFAEESATEAGVKKPNTTSKPVIKAFGLQSNTDKTLYVTWKWDKKTTKNGKEISTTDHYRVVWYYETGDDVWFVGNDSDTTFRQSIYSSAPENAKRVRVKILPVSKTYTQNKKETKYWTADWSAYQTYSFKNNPPVTPSGLTAEIKEGTTTLTAKLTNLDTSVEGINATHIEFQIYKYKNDKPALFTSGKAKIDTKTGYVSYSCTVSYGSTYTVRCRAARGKSYGDWSDFVSDIKTIPAAPARIIECASMEASSGNENEMNVSLKWPQINTATGYIIQYVEDDPTRLDTTTPQEVSIALGDQCHRIIENLSSGKTWYFRVRAKNEAGDGPWSPVRSVLLGTAPGAPTTWSSSNVAIVGEDEEITLYWLHNSKDDSDATSARINFQIIIGTQIENFNHDIPYETVKEGFWDTVKDIPVIGSIAGLFSSGSSKSEEEDGPDMFTIQTSNFPDGAVIKWRVATAGATGTLGDYSAERQIDIYTKPTLGLAVTNVDGIPVDNNEYPLTQFPLYISLHTTPDTQKPIGFHISIEANSSYTTVDEMGIEQRINKGTSIYSKHFEPSELDSVDESSIKTYHLELLPSDVNFDNNIEYVVKATSSMDSGLSAIAESPYFAVSWSDEQWEPNAEIAYDENTYSVSINPFCRDEYGDLIADVKLSVYRREFDGSFTEIIKDVDNSESIYVTDPHPALDYARYRIVATSTITGSVSYYDMPGYPINERAIIIQWDETWSDFNVPDLTGLTTDEEIDSALAAERESPAWAGSLVRLPYNVDVSDSNSLDVEHINYIGRKHPVSYYGTQLGTKSDWSASIPKKDKETLYALRRLANWMGDVYVREPSGSGYWASISVSFSQTHLETTIPVTISVTRVEGGK